MEGMQDNSNREFWDWGLPTTYCIKEVAQLKKEFEFILIASGGVNSGIDVAKSIALGADMAASARIIFQNTLKNGVEGGINLLLDWRKSIENVMFLTGSQNLNQLNKTKLIRVEDLY